MAVKFCLALGVLTFISMAGARLVISLYAIELGAQPFAVGMLIAILQAVPLALSLPVGLLADRWGTRWLMAAGFSSLVLGMLLTVAAPSLTMLFIASGFNGILLAVNNVAVQQLMGSLSRPEQRPRNFSNLALTGAASNFTAPLVAGLSVDQFGHAGACLVMLAVAVAGLLALAAWGAVLPAGKGRAGREEKARHRLPIRRIWPLLAVSALAQTCTDLFLFYVPVYGRGIGLSASAIGVLAAAFGAASLLVRAVTPSVLLRLGEVRMLAYSFYLAAAGFALIPFFDSAYPLIAVSALIGLGAGCGQPVTMMMMVARATEGRSGEMLGLQLTANAVVRTSGPVVLGAAGSLFGLGPVFIAGAVLMALGGATSERAALRPQRTRQSSGAP